MTTLHEVDVRCRGANKLAEEWKADHNRVREVWTLEDIIALFLDCYAAFRDVHAAYVNDKRFPGDDFDFGYFLNVLRIYEYGASLVDQSAGIQESSGHKVAGIDDLRASVQYVDNVIRENQDVDLQKALDKIDASMEERVMSAEEAADVRRALQRPAPPLVEFPPIPHE